MYLNENGGPTYVNSPYSIKNGVTYGVSATVQKITKWSFIYGINFGYETLRSQVTTAKSLGQGIIDLSMMKQKIINNNFLNVSPFIGYRLKLHEFSFDLTTGYELAVRISSQYTYLPTNSYAANFLGIQNNNLQSFSKEALTRVQLAMNYKRIGVYTGYSRSLGNYIGNAINSDYFKAESIVRFGATFKMY